MTPDHKSLSLYFVLSHDHQSEEDASPDMQGAFKAAVDWGIKPQWMKESDCLQADSQLKGQVFVFENFAGDIFTRFTKSHVNSRVIGPKCLLSCFSKNVPIPPTKVPVFNMAMGGLIICSSNVPVDQKKELKELVGYMGGNFFDPLITSTTHLVVNSILSEKYFKACEIGVKIMKKSWIEYVWKKNFVSDIVATDESIIHEYKVPIFYNLKVTASGLSEKEKRKIEKIIRDNGGTYTQEMPKGTDVLILPTGKGEKFKFAERWKTKCLNPSWIECSLKKGYAVRYQEYIVHSAEKKCSTPVNTCNKMVPLINANDSDISIIPSGSTKSVVCDTQMDSALTIRNNTFKTPVKDTSKSESSQKPGNSTNYRTVLNDIVLTDVKKCGPLLDGCKVYLSGFKDNEEEKIRRILNYGGAIRFTELNESVTHVIVGDPNKHDLNNIKMAHHMPHIVTLDWLLGSIKKGCLEEEANCAYILESKKDEPQTSKVSQQPSPLSKKGLQMLKPTRNVFANPEPATEIDHNLIERYSLSSNPLPHVTELKGEMSNHLDPGELPNDQIEPNLTNDKLFAGLKFAIIGHELPERDELKKTVVDLGGFVSEEHRKIDYAILPMTNVFQDFRFAEVVSSVWIDECIRESRIVEIKYYHRPLTIPDPLINKSSNAYVITFSSYSIQERQYLELVAEFLGARCQDVLSRKVDKDRNIAQTSHLVSALAQGAKYNAAKKWNLPIVTEKWLLDSFNQRKLLPLNPYLLGADGDHRLKEETMNSRTDESLSTKSKTNGLRLAIPTLAEAVGNKSDNVCIDQNNRRKTEMKDLPLGLLAQINRASSSTIKRKVDDDLSNFEAARICSPRRKLLRADAGNVTSSYEEVGWQDTLTDIQLEDVSSSREKKNSTDVKMIKEDDVSRVLPRDNLLNGNNMDGCIAEKLPRDDNPKKNQKNSDNNLKNCEVNMNNEEGENESKKSQLRLNPREQRILPAKIDTKKIYWNMMISVNEKEKKVQCENIIKDLGGKVITRFDPDASESERATHLIIDDLKKTEKLLCSISSGLWVLHSSYLLQSRKIGKFIDEEEFEWGNPLSKNLPTKESNDYLWIAKAAHRWRRRIQNEGPCNRPFVGMKAVIISSGKDEAMQSLIRVVKSGGGCLVQSNEILKATHCLVTSVKNLDNLPVSMNALAAKRIHCLPAVYLSDYLMTDPPPEPESCYFDAYKRLF